jgi:hypothetical protein
MLTEEQKAQLRAEEYFRSEVREEIARNCPAASGAKRLWHLLNSQFALWFLSSVVISGVTWIAVSSINEYKSAKERKEHTRALCLEIQCRLTQAFRALRLDASRANADYLPQSIYATYVGILNNADFITRRSPNGDVSVFPEFRERTFRSLLFVAQNSLKASEAEVIRSRDLSSFEDLLDRASTNVEATAETRKRAFAEATRIITQMRVPRAALADAPGVFKDWQPSESGEQGKP